MMSTAVRKEAGQSLRGPSEVVLQSNADSMSAMRGASCTSPPATLSTLLTIPAVASSTQAL
ncbi:hypothetical protein U1700_14440, partial [Sphingomonas sp. RB1R13]